MKKTLLYLDEDLQSSIALRYADYLSTMIDTEIHIVHVEEPDMKEQAGTGWVRRSWEAGVIETGAQVIERLMKTEKIKCRINGAPKILIGDKDYEVLTEIRQGAYDIYMEGHIDTGSVDRFFDVISAKRYQQTACPKLMVKNLTVSDKVAILLGDGVAHRELFERCRPVVKDSKFTVDIIYFKYRKQDNLTLEDASEGGSDVSETADLLNNAGIKVTGEEVICGTPEQAGDFLRNYAFIISTLPERRSLRMEVLAHSPASLFLC
jgi:hypothetical protein